MRWQGISRSIGNSGRRQLLASDERKRQADVAPHRGLFAIGICMAPG